MSFGGGGSPDTPDPTQQERALARKGAQDWNLARGTFHPLERRYMTDMRTTAGERALAEGVASASSASAVSDAVREALPGVAQGGSALAVADAERAGAASAGSGRLAARLEADRSDLAGLVKMAAVGRGLSDQGQVGLSNAARLGTQAAIDRSQIRNKRSQMLGDAVGFGLGAASQASGLMKGLA